MSSLSPQILDQALHLLAEEMASKGIPRHDLVVCGGSALLALKFSQRSTEDVDILAKLDSKMELATPSPLSKELVDASENIRRLLDLPEDWFNTGPSDQLKAGLPEGFTQRLTAMEFGPALCVHYTGRYDLIHLKLFAAVDQGPGKHVQDLNSLNPTKEELLAAAKWVATQDEGEAFPWLLKDLLTKMGHNDIADQL